MSNIRWVAELSDGEVIAEEDSDFKVIPGERTPWVRLTELLKKSDSQLRSLKLQIGDREITLPGSDFEGLEPDFYSLCYHIHAEMGSTGLIETKFVELSAHYGELAVSLIQPFDNDDAWIVVSKGKQVLAPTPLRKDE